MKKYPRFIFALLSIFTCLLSGLVISDLMADPGIFRCGEPGKQSYSQIPCEETSEQIVIEDQRMSNDATTAEIQVTADGEDDSVENETSQTKPANNVQAFITQLEKQRTDQLNEIDRSIREIESRAATEGEGDEGEDSTETPAMLDALLDTRQAIVAEYDAMISAAQQRMDGN